MMAFTVSTRGYSMGKCYIASVVSFFNTLGTSDKNSRNSANSVDLEKVAHNEPPHLDLHCFPSSL